MGGVAVEFRCADGAPFPVTFRDERDLESTWRIDLEHCPRAAPPLAARLDEVGHPGGARAYAEVGLAMPSVWFGQPDANGYIYGRAEPMPADELAELSVGLARLVERFGSAHSIWREHSRPRVEEVCERLRSAPPTSLVDIACEQSYAFQLTMIPAFVGGNDINLLEAALRDVAGADARRAALELAQGHGDATTRANAAMWQLADAARRSPAVAAAVTGADPAGDVEALRGSSDATAFFTALDTFVDEYGWRTEEWSPARPCWRELGPGFWSVLAAQVRWRSPSPEASVAAAAFRRRELLDRYAAVVEDPDARARLQRRAARVDTYVDMREDRAHWQLVICGSTRQALLALGRALVDQGATDQPDDVFFLLPGEVDGLNAPVDLRATVAARRAEHAHWSGVTPPAVLDPGAETGRSPTLERKQDGKRPENAPEGRNVSISLQGIGASRGTASGVARVVRDLADAHRVEPGDVLVCPTTSPPWTPLYGLVAAVVVDSGDLGSHSAITAREYGIPAVLATGDGTRVIPDGAVVEVDGDAGTVTIDGTGRFGTAPA